MSKSLSYMRTKLFRKHFNRTNYLCSHFCVQYQWHSLKLPPDRELRSWCTVINSYYFSLTVCHLICLEIAFWRIAIPSINPNFDTMRESFCVQGNLPILRKSMAMIKRTKLSSTTLPILWIFISMLKRTLIPSQHFSGKHITMTWKIYHWMKLNVRNWTHISGIGVCLAGGTVLLLLM